MSRECAEDKAVRFLAAGRLDVIEVSDHVIRATCRGDTGEWRLGWAGEWWCTCPAWSRRCSHVSALKLVTVRTRHSAPE